MIAWSSATCGILLWLAPAFAHADYTSPTLGTYLTNPQDLDPENIRILQELALPNGDTLLEVAADLRNLDSAQWSGVIIGASKAVADGTAAVLSSTLGFGELAAGTVAAAASTMHVVVAAADAPLARAEILSGAVLSAVAHTADGTAAAIGAVAIEQIAIVSELVLADGRRLILFTCNARNATAEALQDVVVNFSKAATSIAYDFALGASEIASVTSHGPAQK
jgi:hypothetical protein